MWKKLKKPLLFVGSTGAVGTAAYFAFAKSFEEKEESIQFEKEAKMQTGPKWLSKLKSVNKNSLNNEVLKFAQDFAELGDEKIAKNWVDIFCQEEKKSEKDLQDYCNKEE